MTRTHCYFRLSSGVLAAATLLYLIFAHVGWSAAQEQKVTCLETTIHLNETGDATFHQDLSMPLRSYQVFRQEIGSPVKLIRKMQSMSSWNKIEAMKGDFDEVKHQVSGSFEHIGFSRSVSPGTWRVDFAEEEQPKLITIQDNVAIFSSADSTGLGAMSMILRVHTPPQSRNLRFNEREKNLTYEFTPEIAEGEQCRHSLDLDCKPQLMSSLAKLYGNEQLDAFWAARSVFKNTGDRTVTDYRIRFRVEGFSSWSNWKKSASVYPGQTVVDPFFPVLDYDKLAAITGSRPALIHCEYEYKVGGEVHQETESARIQVTSRNEVVFSSRSDGENLDWYEQNDLAEYILAAFTTSQDPLVQQLAGIVSGMAGGVAASSDNQQAIQFLMAFWDYLEVNKVAYHTPPGWSINGYFGQHVKYGRDVIRNRAGTCIDLSILWASVAKAVGLEVNIALVWGHAYPVIELPEGQLLPIESTMMGKYSFEEAVDMGIDNFNSPERGLIILADIDALEKAGVRSLDLPKLDDDYLSKLGYQARRGQQASSNEAGQAFGQNNQGQRGASEDVRQGLVGGWVSIAETPNGKLSAFVMELGADGRCASAFGTLEEEQFVRESRMEGSWSVQGNTLVFSYPDGSSQMPFEYRQNQLILSYEGQQYEFQRMEK